MATEKAKKSFGAGFMTWYESYSGKRAVGAIYSVGAAVVIIGAMFKILHIEGASIMLGAGMITEAILFTIGVFDKPHVEFHWENVFPQLYGNGEGIEPSVYKEVSSRPKPTLLGAGVDNSTPASLKNEAEPAKAPALKDEDFKALKEGIADLAKTASQFSELGKVAQTGVKLGEKLAAAEVATESYSSKMTEATEAYVAKMNGAAEAYVAKLSAAGNATDSFTQATAGLAGTYAKVSEDMKSVADETRAYKQGVEQVGQKLASLNSVYELQLQAVNAQVEAQKSAAAAAKEAAEAQTAFAKGTKDLQKQVADLNAIYGNMLNALA